MALALAPWSRRNGRNRGARGLTFVLLSVLCSVAVSVLLKLAPRWNVDVRQAIAGNYVVSAGLVALLLDPRPGLLLLPVAHPAWRVLLALGVLLPSIFLAQARSVRHAGVVRTDAAQRLSLLLSLVAAFTIFGELLTWQKGAGMVIALVAIVCIVVRKQALSMAGESARAAWAWPLVVFCGMGVIDVLFKRVAELTRVPFPDVLWAAFVLAAVLALLAVAWLYARGRARWHWRHLGGALVLGLLNFGNIVFYIRAHQVLAHDPALVFTSMNIGVIVLAALVGLWWFREPLSRLNRVGVLLAIAAVAVLATA